MNFPLLGLEFLSTFWKSVFSPMKIPKKTWKIPYFFYGFPNLFIIKILFLQYNFIKWLLTSYTNVIFDGDISSKIVQFNFFAWCFNGSKYTSVAKDSPLQHFYYSEENWIWMRENAIRNTGTLLLILNECLWIRWLYSNKVFLQIFSHP